MSVINSDRDLQMLVDDLRTGDLSKADMLRIADALPDHVIELAFLEKMKGTPIADLIDAAVRFPNERLGQVIANAIIEWRAREFPAAPRPSIPELFSIPDNLLGIALKLRARD